MEGGDWVPVLRCAAAASAAASAAVALRMLLGGKKGKAAAPMAPTTLPPGIASYSRDLVNKQGLKLATYTFTPPAPKGVILFIHGSRAHFQYDFMLNDGAPGEEPRYEGSWLAYAVERGFVCVGLDLQGHGRSDSARGKVGYVERFDHLVDDVDCVLEYCSQRHPGLPFFAVGVSLGGCVAVNSALRRPSAYRGLVLLAPMLRLERISKQGANPYLKPLADLLDVIAPTASLVHMPASPNPVEARRYELDALTQKGAGRVRNACEFLKATASTSLRSVSLDVPFLVFQSADDTAVDPEGAEMLVEKSQTNDATLRWATGMWHALTKEKGWQALRSESFEWMGARL